MMQLLSHNCCIHVLLACRHAAIHAACRFSFLIFEDMEPLGDTEIHWQ